MSTLQCISRPVCECRQSTKPYHTQVSTYRKGGVEVLHGFGIPDCPEEVHMLMLDMLQVALHHDNVTVLNAAVATVMRTIQIEIYYCSECRASYGHIQISNCSACCNCQCKLFCMLQLSCLFTCTSSYSHHDAHLLWICSIVAQSSVLEVLRVSISDCSLQVDTYPQADLPHCCLSKQ